MANITNITPPRVPMVDPQTGLITRDWYRFFLNLFNLTGGGQSDLTVFDIAIQPQSPNPQTTISAAVSEAQLASYMATYDMAVAALTQDVKTQPVGPSFAAVNQLLNDLQLGPTAASNGFIGRNFTYNGDVTGGPTYFNDTADVSTPLTLATAQGAAHTWALTQTFTVAPVFTDVPGSRTALALGTGNNPAFNSVVTAALTVATLPGAPVAGQRSFVTDATAPAFGVNVVGGGAVPVPVYYSGTAWVVG